jgi:hypothetical protein
VNRQALRWKNNKPVLAEKVWDTLAVAITRDLRHSVCGEINHQCGVSCVIC